MTVENDNPSLVRVTGTVYWSTTNFPALTEPGAMSNSLHIRLYKQTSPPQGDCTSDVGDGLELVKEGFIDYVTAPDPGLPGQPPPTRASASYIVDDAPMGVLLQIVVTESGFQAPPGKQIAVTPLDGAGDAFALSPDTPIKGDENFLIKEVNAPRPS